MPIPADILSLVQRTTIPNGATASLLHFLLPAGTIDGVKIDLEGANASSNVIFNFYVDGVAQYTNELTVASGTNEITTTGLAETVTNDNWGTISIETPFTSGALSGVTAIGVHIIYETQTVNLTGNQTVAGDKTFTGATDFGGATSLELPNSATPTVNADGEIAIDTSVADFSHGVMKYYGGEELGVVAMPVAEFATPTDGHVVAYNATNDEFELVAQSGGGVDTANSPGAGEWAKFTDADTIEGRTNSELIADLSLEIGVDVQAWDAQLDTWATVTPSANGQSLVSAADYAAMRGLLDLEVGTDVQAYDADLTTWAGITPGTNVGTQLALNANGSDDEAIGYRGIPQNSQSDNYTLVLADSGKHIYETGASKTVTIPANASVAFPIGTTVSFVATDAGGCTIAITSDTLRWSDDGTTGSRTLAQYGLATALKVTSTEWLISGTGLS